MHDRQAKWNKKIIINHVYEPQDKTALDPSLVTETSCSWL